MIAYDDDRLVRGVGLTCFLEEEFEKAGIQVHYCIRVRDLSPEGRFTSHMKVVVGEYELYKIQERTRRGQRARVQHDLPLLGRGIPLGYSWIPASKESRGELVVDTGEAELVREIFQLRLQGQGSYRIARLLTLRGIKTKCLSR
jgi:site-specific DNA recombinase